MELRFDFYSQEEMSVRLELAEYPSLPSETAREFFYFAAFTLTQFAKGSTPLTMLLGALLMSLDEEKAAGLGSGSYVFPTGAALRKIPSEHGVDIGVSQDVFEKNVLGRVPRLAAFKGEAKKGFVMSYPPLKTQARGFGPLGFQVSYFVFHAIFALLRMLAAKHAGDEEYLRSLTSLAVQCGRLHRSAGAAGQDPTPLVLTLVKSVASP